MKHIYWIFLILLLVIRCGDRRAAPDDPSVPTSYVETWCRVTGASPETSFFVEAALTNLERRVVAKLLGEHRTSLPVSQKTLDSDSLVYEATGVRIVISRPSVSAYHYSAVITEDTTVGPIERLGICRALELTD